MLKTTSLDFAFPFSRIRDPTFPACTNFSCFGPNLPSFFIFRNRMADYTSFVLQALQKSDLCLEFIQYFEMENRRRQHSGSENLKHELNACPKYWKHFCTQARRHLALWERRAVLFSPFGSHYVIRRRGFSTFPKFPWNHDFSRYKIAIQISNWNVYVLVSPLAVIKLHHSMLLAPHLKGGGHSIKFNWDERRGKVQHEVIELRYCKQR